VSTKFVVIASTLKAVANIFPAKNSKMFFLLAQLGTGKSGTTYLAANESGRHCAVKMYIPKRSVAATVDTRQAEWTDRYNEEVIKRDE
jgi:serine/threonine-protein kinase RIO1